jgi:hypothetical protein
MAASKVLTILAAAALLLVVLLPYTPTPTALATGKILLAIVALATCVFCSETFVVAPSVYSFRENSSPQFCAYAVLNLICLRL